MRAGPARKLSDPTPGDTGFLLRKLVDELGLRVDGGCVGPTDFVMDIC